MKTPLVRYLVVATTGSLPQKLKADYRFASNGIETVKSVLDITGLEAFDTTRIAKLKNQNKNVKTNTGDWAMRECNRKMRLRMKEDDFTLSRVTFYGVGLNPKQSLDMMECFDEFTMHLSLPDDQQILAVSVMDINVGNPGSADMQWYSTLSSNRNKPTPHETKYCEAKPGQVIKVAYRSSYSNMDDSWSHRDAVHQYYAVIKANKTGSTLDCMQVHDYNEATGAGNDMTPVTLKRKVVSNTLYWDQFYNMYYWQDLYKVVDVFDYPG